MARVKRGVVAHARHKEVLKLASGYRGRASTAFASRSKKSKKPFATLIAIARPKSATCAPFGSSASTRRCVKKV
jgi:ribosomal protein L20